MTEETNNGQLTAVPDAGDHLAVHPEHVVELQDADLGAGKPVQTEHKPTEREIRAWRAANWTVKHPIVKACGHRIDLRHAPRHANCKHCWQALFEVGFNAQEMERLHNLLMNAGSKFVVKLYGKKFLQAFGAWLKEKLLRQASPETQAASGLEPVQTIEGGTLDIKAEQEVISGLR